LIRENEVRIYEMGFEVGSIGLWVLKASLGSGMFVKSVIALNERIHSYLKESAGFLEAALTVWEKMIRKPTANTASNPWEKMANPSSMRLAILCSII
jgi:hypothetical protein